MINKMVYRMDLGTKRLMAKKKKNNEEHTRLQNIRFEFLLEMYSLLHDQKSCLLESTLIFQSTSL